MRKYMNYETISEAIKEQMNKKTFLELDTRIISDDQCNVRDETQE